MKNVDIFLSFPKVEKFPPPVQRFSKRVLDPFTTDAAHSFLTCGGNLSWLHIFSYSPEDRCGDVLNALANLRAFERSQMLTTQPRATFNETREGASHNE